MFLYADCHSHLAECLQKDENAVISLLERDDYSVLTSVHSLHEFEVVSALKSRFPKKVGISYGVLPQNPSFENLEILKSLLENPCTESQIDCVGECGIDLFDAQFKSTVEIQREIFKSQIELAINYKKPLVIHQRKAMSEIFAFSSDLAKVPAVLFHGYSGTYDEALSVLRKNVNAYFSFGKSVLRGDKKAVLCLEKLPYERIRFETDSPYQLPPEKIFDILTLCAKH
ncbi:MAG: TatD family hydrolase [Treponemataceae bacterium]|nr:TatD family hydrolase [Treponemataceae bacterium]